VSKRDKLLEKERKTLHVRTKSDRSVQEENDNKEGKSRAGSRSDGRRKITIAAVVFACLLAFIVIGLAVWGYSVTNSGAVYPNVYADGCHIGGLTGEETEALLKEKGWDDKAAAKLRVQLPADVSFELDVCDAGAVFTKEKTAELALEYGRGSGIFSNLFSYFKNLTEPVDIVALNRVLDDDYIYNAAKDGVNKFIAATSANNTDFNRDKGYIKLMKGAGGMTIELDSLCSAIDNALISGEKLLNYETLETKPEMPDFEAIYEKYCTEARDAYYTETFDVVDEVSGCVFDRELGKKLWNEAELGEYIEIPLESVEPELTGDELRSLIFRDRLSTQTTSYSGSTANRINNIKLCASKLHGLILYPGDVFSFNTTIGRRTEEAGFLPAGAYSDGEVVEAVGGGICQVSSTLYCASMLSQMSTRERVSHYFRVGYLPLGCDATVSWGGPDFRFENTRDFPVRIAAYCDDSTNSVTVEIWGTDTDGSYVELSHKEFDVFDEEYKDVLIGTGVRTYRNIYDSEGNLQNTIKEPYGVYHLHKEDIKWPEGVMEDEKKTEETFSQDDWEQDNWGLSPEDYFNSIVPDSW
jgi:vancomycin resistance protein YoaR